LGERRKGIEFILKSKNGVDGLECLALHGMTTVIILKEFFRKVVVFRRPSGHRPVVDMHCIGRSGCTQLGEFLDQMSH